MKKQKSIPFQKIAIGVGILAVLLLIPFTRTFLVALGAFIGGLLIWIAVLFALVLIIKWLLGKFHKKK